MKNVYILWLTTLCTITLKAEMPYREKYQLLQKRPAYHNMSPIEIAAEIEDFGAIRHFSYQSSQQALLEARANLENKLGFLYQDLKKAPPKDENSSVQTAQDKDLIHRKIRQIKNVNENLSRKIELLRTVEKTNS